MDHHPGQTFTRREALGQVGTGLGMLGLFGLLGDSGYLGSTARAADRSGAPTTIDNPLAPRPPHFPGRAKHLIHIYLNGGPSQVDTFDPKPLLKRYEGKTLPQGNLTTERKTAPRWRRRSGSASTVRAASRSARSSPGRPSTSTTSA